MQDIPPAPISILICLSIYFSKIWCHVVCQLLSLSQFEAINFSRYSLLFCLSFWDLENSMLMMKLESSEIRIKQVQSLAKFDAFAQVFSSEKRTSIFVRIDVMSLVLGGCTKRVEISLIFWSIWVITFSTTVRWEWTYIYKFYSLLLTEEFIYFWYFFSSPSYSEIVLISSFLLKFPIR